MIYIRYTYVVYIPYTLTLLSIMSWICAFDLWSIPSPIRYNTAT